MRKKAIIVDIDGTAGWGNHGHLWHADKPDYELINTTIRNDNVQAWCREIIENFSANGYSILFVTARDERARAGTEAWIGSSFNFGGAPVHLFMRKAKDETPDWMMKKKVYDENIAGIYDVLFCLEDKQEVSDMWRTCGLVCLHCENTGMRP